MCVRRDSEDLNKWCGGAKKRMHTCPKDAHTKRPKTKRPRDKTSHGTKRPRNKMSQVTNRPKGTNEAHYLTYVANYLIQYGLA